MPTVSWRDVEARGRGWRCATVTMLEVRWELNACRLLNRDGWAVVRGVIVFDRAAIRWLRLKELERGQGQLTDDLGHGGLRWSVHRAWDPPQGRMRSRHLPSNREQPHIENDLCLGPFSLCPYRQPPQRHKHTRHHAADEVRRARRNQLTHLRPRTPADIDRTQTTTCRQGREAQHHRLRHPRPQGVHRPAPIRPLGASVSPSQYH